MGDQNEARPNMGPGEEAGAQAKGVIPPLGRGFMRKEDAADYLNVSLRTLSDMMRRRQVRFARWNRKVVRFRKSDLDRAYENFAVNAVGD